MNAKFIIEVDARHEATLRRVLAMAEEMEQLGLAAPEEAVCTALLDLGFSPGAAAVPKGGGQAWLKLAPRQDATPPTG